MDVRDVYEMQKNHEEKCDKRQAAIHAKIDNNTSELHKVVVKIEKLSATVAAATDRKKTFAVTSLLVLSPIAAVVVSWWLAG